MTRTERIQSPPHPGLRPEEPVASRPGAARRRPPLLDRQWGWLLLFMAAHAPLALLIKKVHLFSTVHALACFVVGIAFALSNRPKLVACLGAYMASSEILWRMTGAKVFWEYGKYGIALLFIISMFLSRRLLLRPAPILYFFLLLPAVVPTLIEWEWADSRRDISFNMSGPFALMIAVLFFHRLKMERVDVLRLFASFLSPLIGIAAIAGSAVLSSAIVYGQGSNELASGGFGPNQVSSALGLGILISFLGIMDRRIPRPLKLIFFGIILAFTTQSALTLSRSGLVIAATCVATAAFFLVRNGSLRLQLLGSGLVLFALFHYVIFPKVDAFTGGAISARFTNTNPTGRDKIMLVDLKIWSLNPVFGVGVGEAQMERMKYYRLIAAHNEFTRLVAEHGLLGFSAAILLVAIAWQSFRRARGAPAKALVASMICFSFLFMLGNGMRLALVSYTFGLAGASFAPALVRRRETTAQLEPVPVPPPGLIHPSSVSPTSRRPVRQTG